MIIGQEIYQSHQKVIPTPITRKEWCDYRGWDLPEDENGDDKGYMVEHLDGGPPNDSRHEHYIMWTTKEQFDRGYSKLRADNIDSIINPKGHERPKLKLADLDDLEALSEEVHNAWWKEKKAQGFHAPKNCPVRSITNCNKCHTDMISYSELPESIKEYGRVTVRIILNAQKEIARKEVVMVRGRPISLDELVEPLDHIDPERWGDVSDGYHTFNELYQFRKMYNAVLFNEWAFKGWYEVHKSLKHYDGESCFDGNWFIVIANLPTGQIRQHYKIEDWHLFNVVDYERALSPPRCHTPQDTLGTLERYAHSFLNTPSEEVRGRSELPDPLSGGAQEVQKILNKALHNSPINGTRKNVKDLQAYGDIDLFKCLAKASSDAGDWMKTTKAMEIEGAGCLVQVTTQQGDNIAEALAFVPNTKIELIDGDKSNGRRLVSAHPVPKHCPG